MLYFSRAWEAQSTASCCMSSLISAFFMTALRSAMINNYVEGISIHEGRGGVDKRRQ